eukprot:Gregarina_sp_Poly_1__4160@NODE_2277_length_2368_cov_81_178618_g1457_i0_p2_GENE_NODE_2277_length_2368_cov_81_178618_g1457_i0NODE_2277_length_2368_cov_81_178618_g1457_i0_p2_ORF_typecomplete_len198_score7_82Alg14/PF08660_11/9e37Glycos_transf_N/PF04413_16/0_16_NODE_2277_length_2368_cov_81_178618_g1457_i017342327
MLYYILLFLFAWVLRNIGVRVWRIAKLPRCGGRRPTPPTGKSLWIVLGSGGHTTEMLHLIKGLDLRYTKVVFVLAETDQHSQSLAVAALGKTCADVNVISQKAIFHRIRRIREVRESFWVTPLNTLIAVRHLLPAMWWHPPSALLLNGPGTCLSVVGSSLLYEIFLGFYIPLIYVESFCRTKNLSYTGKILFLLVDR